MNGSRAQAKTDFSQGPVWRRVLDQAGPLILAQLVHLLYNIVDRIYIGHMDDGSGLALTGVRLTFPIVTLIMAFAALFGNGGMPLFAMARGAKDEARAGRILGNACTLQLISAIVLMAVGYLFMRPILFAFGASEDSFVYARAYLNIYLAGAAFSMLATASTAISTPRASPRSACCPSSSARR